MASVLSVTGRLCSLRFLELGQTRPNSNSLPQVILTYRKCLSHLSVAWLPLVASQEDDAMICHGKVCNLMILDVS